MATLVTLKKDLEFTGEMVEMIDVFKGAAISQFRHLQNRRKRFDTFTHELDQILGAIEFDTPPHPFVIGNASLPRALVLVTSDEGFLGEYNGAVINSALNQRQKGDELIVLGERGSRYLEDMQESFVYFPGVGEEITYEEAKKLRDYLVSQYLREKIGEVVFVYARFISFGSYEVSILPLLPCDFLFQREEEVSRVPPWVEEGVSIEPSVAKVLDYIIRLWLSERIYDIFWESKLSEWAARVIHMEGSSQELSHRKQKLSFQYFRLVHEISDKNIREIFASRSLWGR